MIYTFPHAGAPFESYLRSTGCKIKSNVNRLIQFFSVSSEVIPELDVKEMSHCPIYIYILFFFGSNLEISPRLRSLGVCYVSVWDESRFPTRATVSRHLFLPTASANRKPPRKNSLSIRVFFFQCQDVFKMKRRLLTASTFFGIQVDVDL